MSLNSPDLSVNLGGVRMKNPVMVASGTFGYGPEYADLVDLNRLGALVVKGISLEPWRGNPPPRTVEVASGLINAIGLQNPGAEGFLRDYLPFLRQFDVPVIVNIWGRTVEEYAAVAERLSAALADRYAVESLSEKGEKLIALWGGKLGAASDAAAQVIALRA